ncbi:32741_t:CDS:1, partial [Racocetra persica]
MSNKNKIILQYPTKEQYNTIDNIPGSKSRDTRRPKLKMKIESYQHRFKVNGRILKEKKSRVKRKHRSETSSNLKQEEQEEGTVDSSSQPLNTKATTSSNFLANTKKTGSPFAEDSQEFETADSNSEINYSNEFVIPFQNNYFELLPPQSL